MTSGPPALQREFRGAWIATVDNIDWPSKPGLPEEKQRAELQRILKRLAALRFNAVLFQVRPAADALYQSDLEPSSWFLTGEQGKPITFDPLAYAVEEGHRLGLEVHAWFNPFRAVHPAQKAPCCCDHVSVSQPSWVRTYGVYQWLDPGVPEAREHSLKVIMDVVRRYDIDGVHIDDYFYPYPAGSAEFPDSETYQRYGHDLGLKDWRRSNVDLFIQTLYKDIKAKKRWVKFGISPFGIYRPNVPTGIKAGIDQYDDLAADALKWFQSGWCDYISPQLYWKIDSSGQPFGKLLKWWAGVNTQKRHLWPGLYTSLINKSWTSGEILDQIRLSRNVPGAEGQVHFSASPLMKDPKSLSSSLAAKVYSNHAVVPASPWLGEQKPAKPTLTFRTKTRIDWSEARGARFYSRWELRGSKWVSLGLSSDTTLAPSDEASKIAVIAISKTGIPGSPLTISLKKHG